MLEDSLWSDSHTFKAEDGSFEQGDDDKNTAGPSQKKVSLGT